ncbi:MAG: antibiotic biosynthesis monooxygenase [Hyphomonas sp.]|uniref:putative quinol monooxygenase n=1 Tax=Hyphomonas sp. TaxID=87 RepID=UPI00349FE3B8
MRSFQAIMDGVESAVQTEAGFVSAGVYRNVDTPNKFVPVEVWETKALPAAHQATLTRPATGRTSKAC